MRAKPGTSKWQAFTPRNYRSEASAALGCVESLRALARRLWDSADLEVWLLFSLYLAGLRTEDIEQIRVTKTAPYCREIGRAYLSLAPCRLTIPRLDYFSNQVHGAHLPLDFQFAELLASIVRGRRVSAVERRFLRHTKQFRRHHGEAELRENRIARTAILWCNGFLDEHALAHQTRRTQPEGRASLPYYQQTAYELAVSFVHAYQAFLGQAGILNGAVFVVPHRNSGAHILGSPTAVGMDEVQSRVTKAKEKVREASSAAHTGLPTVEGHIDVFNNLSAYTMLALGLGLGLRASGEKMRIERLREDLVFVSDKASTGKTERNLIPLGDILRAVVNSYEATLASLLRALASSVKGLSDRHFVTPLHLTLSGNKLKAVPMTSVVARRLLGNQDLKGDWLRHTLANLARGRLPQAKVDHWLRHNRSALDLANPLSAHTFKGLVEIRHLQDELLWTAGIKPLKLQFERLPPSAVVSIHQPKITKKPARPSFTPGARAVHYGLKRKETLTRVKSALRRATTPEQFELLLLLCIVYESFFAPRNIAALLSVLAPRDAGPESIQFPLAVDYEGPFRCPVQLGPLGKQCLKKLRRYRKECDYLFSPDITIDRRPLVQQALEGQLRCFFDDTRLKISILAASVPFAGFLEELPPCWPVAFRQDSLPADATTVQSDIFDAQAPSVSEYERQLVINREKDCRAAKSLLSQTQKAIAKIMPRMRGKRDKKFSSARQADARGLGEIINSAKQDAAALGFYSRLTQAALEFMRVKVRNDRIQLVSLRKYVQLGIRDGLLGHTEIEDFDFLEAGEHDELAFEVVDKWQKATTRRNALIALSMFYRIASANGYCERPPEICSMDEGTVTALRALLIPPREFETRMATLVWTDRDEAQAGIAAILGYYAGIRSGELEHMTLADIAPQSTRNNVIVWRGKSRAARRRIPFSVLASEDSVDWLLAWYERRRAEFGPRTSLARINLFGPEGEKSGYPQGYMPTLANAFTRRSFGDDVNFHVLRHCFISYFLLDLYDCHTGRMDGNGLSETPWRPARLWKLLREGRNAGESDFAEICKIVGHAHPETMFRHYAHTMSRIQADMAQTFGPLQTRERQSAP